MIILHGRAEIERGLTLPLARELHDLLAERLQHLTSGEHDLAEDTVVAVFEPGDTDVDLQEVLGWGLLTNPYDDAVYPSATYQPWVDHLHRVGPTTYEAIVTVGNSGWGVQLLIPIGELLPVRWTRG